MTGSTPIRKGTKARLRAGKAGSLKHVLGSWCQVLRVWHPPDGVDLYEVLTVPTRDRLVVNREDLVLLPELPEGWDVRESPGETRWRICYQGEVLDARKTEEAAWWRAAQLAKSLGQW